MHWIHKTEIPRDKNLKLNGKEVEETIAVDTELKKNSLCFSASWLISAKREKWSVIGNEMERTITEVKTKLEVILSKG